jgi:hypothetical protein
MAVDTANHCMVAPHRRLVVVQRPPHQLTPAHACELAAWLVAMAEVASMGEFDADAHFAEALEAVRNT